MYQNVQHKTAHQVNQPVNRRFNPISFVFFFNFKLECDYWRKIAAFFRATSHYNAINSLNATANHTASVFQLLFACKPFWPQRKSRFYSRLRKMKHSREFVVTKLLKVAETNAKRHSIEETLFGCHVKHNESSKGLIYCPPDAPNQGTL